MLNTPLFVREISRLVMALEKGKGLIIFFLVSVERDHQGGPCLEPDDQQRSVDAECIYHAGDCLHQFWTLFSLHCSRWHHYASLLPLCNRVLANVRTIVSSNCHLRCIGHAGTSHHEARIMIPSTNDSLDVWKNVFITMLIIAGISLALVYSGTLQCIWLL